MKESLISVGIDVGTSTTQVIFSKIQVENLASGARVPEFKIVDKEVFYKGAIHFTPLASRTRIDENALKAIIAEEYRKADMEPHRVDSGAVIITGETARKENAENIMNALVGYAGEFVVATAGPDLEGILAGKGCGAAKVSDDTGRPVVNLDIGGGTTNIAVFRDGDPVDTACLDIGGRLVRFDEKSRLEYVAESLLRLARLHDLDLYEGMVRDESVLKVLVEKMAEVLYEAVTVKDTKGLQAVVSKKGKLLEKNTPIEMVSFSGGVSDYIYFNAQEEDVYRYDDIGILLGRAIRDLFQERRMEVMVPTETIMATVVGAGTQTMDISGSTITFTDQIFPLKNIPIAALSREEERETGEALTETIVKKLEWYSLEQEKQRIALFLRGQRNMGFKEIKGLAKSIADAFTAYYEKEEPLVVVVEEDMGKVLGQSILQQLVKKRDVICIDSIRVGNGDYIDIGKPLGDGAVLPVIIKTIVFNY